MSKDPELTIQFAQIAFDQVCPELDDDPDRRTLGRIIAFRKQRKDERHAFQDAVRNILQSIKPHSRTAADGPQCTAYDGS
jgi:hypothetical protein